MRALLPNGGTNREDPGAAKFGLVRLRSSASWRAARPAVVADRSSHAGSCRGARCRHSFSDAFVLDRWPEVAKLLEGARRDFLLLSDGLRAIRIDAPRSTFSDGPVCLRYAVEGLATAEPLVLTLSRLLALCRTGEFARSLHPVEPRARRWILALRASDGLLAGASHRELSRNSSQPVRFSSALAEPGAKSPEPGSAAGPVGSAFFRWVLSFLACRSRCRRQAIEGRSAAHEQGGRARAREVLARQFACDAKFQPKPVRLRWRRPRTART